MPDWRTTFYAPGAGGNMEGPFATSRKNPLTGRYDTPFTLDDVRLGRSPWVTVASDPSRYGQTLNLGSVTYRSPIDQQSYTLPNVQGYVHDTGSAFQGRPDKIDIAQGDFRGWNPRDAENFVAGGNSASPEGRPTMPDPSLMDMLQPQQSFTDRLGGMSNSLIGLGMGLLQPYNPWAGTNAWTNALQGYQAGSALDQRAAQQRQNLAMDRARLSLAERQFAQGQVTDAQKAARDMGLTPGSPQFVDFMKSYYAPKTEDWLQGTWTDPYTETPYPYQVHKRTGEVRWLNLPGVTPPGSQPGPPTRAAPNAAPNAPSVFDTGTGGVGYRGQGPFGSSPQPPTPAPEPDPNAPVAQNQPQQPFRTGPKAQELAHNIRKELNQLPEVKRIGEAMPIFRSMIESHSVSTRAADLDFVYGVAKIFDPDSVVREGEMKLVGQARTIPEEIQGWMSRVVNNKAALPPEVRQRILEVAAIRMKQLNESYKQRIEPYRRQLQQSNLDPGVVMPQMLDMPGLTPGAADAQGNKIPTYNPKTGGFD